MAKRNERLKRLTEAAHELLRTLHVANGGLRADPAMSRIAIKLIVEIQDAAGEFIKVLEDVQGPQSLRSTVSVPPARQPQEAIAVVRRRGPGRPKRQLAPGPPAPGPPAAGENHQGGVAEDAGVEEMA